MHGGFSIDTFHQKVGLLWPASSQWHPESSMMLRLLNACAAHVPPCNSNVECGFNQRRFAVSQRKPQRALQDLKCCSNLKSEVICKKSLQCIKQLFWSLVWSQADPTPHESNSKWFEVVGKCLLHLVKVVGSPVVNIMAQSSSYHCKSLKVCVIPLQFASLEGENLHAIC